MVVMFVALLVSYGGEILVPLILPSPLSISVNTKYSRGMVPQAMSKLTHSATCVKYITHAM